MTPTGHLCQIGTSVTNGYSPNLCPSWTQVRFKINEGFGPRDWILRERAAGKPVTMAMVDRARRQREEHRKAGEAAAKKRKRTARSA